MSNLEHSRDLAQLPKYSSIEAGMEIIAGNGIILGRSISGEYDTQSDSFRILFVDSIHPILNFCSSIYEMPAVSIATIGHNRIIIAGDIMPEIVEIKVSIFRSLGLVGSLNTKIEQRKPSYQRLAIDRRLPIDSSERQLAIEPIDWANDGWEYDDDDDLPGAKVLKPKKPNPNLPSSTILVDDDDRC